MVTKMVANRWPRAGIERHATVRATGFHYTNQHLLGQNETGRNGHQQILSQARLPIPPQGLDRCDHSGDAQGVNGPIPCYMGQRSMGHNVEREQAASA